jgi:amino acid adenylation domain-containing protein
VGVIEAGGAYVPLDPGYPAERLRYMIEDSGVEVILTDHAGAKWLPSTAARLLLIEEIGKAAEEVPTASVGPESLAYVIYTSGSTGRPKGVMVEHRPIVRLTKNNPFVHLGPDAVMLQYAPATFDAATFEIWGSLLNGARLVIAPPGTLSLEELGAVIRERQITTLWLTAGLYHLIVDERLDDLRGVRELLAGGEALSADHVKRLLTRAPGVTLINGYGPTEGTTFTCCRPIVSAGEIGETVPIGRPIANTKAYVLDHNLSPVPVGVAGELYIGGDGLARGYVGTPRLTAEQFFPNPFGTGRLYRTGDRVRWTTRGELEFLGRLDEQLKVRGFRVEPSEIESALREHELVGDAVIIGRKPQVGGTTALLGYITRRNGADAPAPGEVREYLRGRLPEHMVPSRILVLDALPLTPNGKIDRKALPALELVTERTAAAIAPRDDLEQLIAATCREVLGVATLSIHDNFFDLGAHSLLITKIHARLQPNLDRELSLVDFFTYPTVATLARFLSSTQEQTSLRKSYERAAARRQAWIRGQRMQSERQGELE